MSRSHFFSSVKCKFICLIFDEISEAYIRNEDIIPGHFCFDSIDRINSRYLLLHSNKFLLNSISSYNFRSHILTVAVSNGRSGTSTPAKMDELRRAIKDGKQYIFVDGIQTYLHLDSLFI